MTPALEAECADISGSGRPGDARVVDENIDAAPAVEDPRAHRRGELVVRNSMQVVRWEIGLEPHTEADVARTMSATLGLLAAAEA